jgi:hypothetical protein
MMTNLLGKRPQDNAPGAATTLMGPVCEQAELHSLLNKFVILI